MSESERVPALLVVDDDPSARKLVVEAVVRAGCLPVEAASCRDAERLLGEDYAAIVMDLHLPDGSGLDVVRALRASGSRTPVIAVSSSREFSAKIEAIRAGADSYLEKPVEPEALSRAIAKIVGDRDEAARILVVEDDPVSARATQRILEDRGFRVCVLADPMGFEQEMLRFSPHLVVMDISLPGVSGVELTRFLRQDPRFETVPVIYLTSAMAIDSAFQAAASGGENVLQKPPHPELLESAIRARLRHFGRLRDLMDRDPLTGALLRRAFFDRAAEIVALASRKQDDVVSLAVVDVDHFKKVNDTHGHPAGDRVLATLGELFRAVLRATDVVARIGGEEFALILPAADALAAKQLLERLLADFSSQSHEGKDGDSFRVTFSAGVVQLSRGMTLDTWMTAADDALYRAKSAGRARVMVVVADAPASSQVIDEDVIERLGSIGGEGDLVREVIALFEESVPGYLTAIRTALLSRDERGVVSAAHALRSSSGNAGARQMAALCATVESAARAAEWETAETTLGRIAAAFPETIAELRRAHAKKRERNAR